MNANEASLEPAAPIMPPLCLLQMASTTAPPLTLVGKCCTHYSPADYARLKVPCASLAYIPMVDLAQRDEPAATPSR